MPKRWFTVLTTTSLLTIAGGATAASPVIRVTNPTDQAWTEAPVVVPWTKAMERAWQAGRRVLAGPEPIAFQRDDLDGDGRIDELVFLAKLGPRETREWRLTDQGTTPAVPPRAHALMSLKGFDGPAWESDVTAYRIYWNADNAMDIFGKTRPRLSLDGWATPGVPHNVENEYGLDVLKVGRAFGIGGFAGWFDGRVEKVSNVMKTHHIRADGPIRAVVELEYVYWQPGPIPDLSREAITSKDAPHYDLVVRMSIFAGQRWGEADITIRPLGDSPMPEIVTGLPRHENTELIRDEKAGVLGRWGRQALGDYDAPAAGDLGLGVIVDPQTVVAYGEDDFNTYVRLRPADGRVRYRYHGSWFKEPGAAKSTAEYERMLRDVAALRPIVEIQ
ncbi:MAG TPA: DUF4861 family protein [Phycisphaerae bacterium]|nr:DUF4861 family protein [Phycisphaerae bacterium]HOJ74253.1 DUF4861 family protein [Phycisphaerae bacterium]HOM51332.1 DUF4861 family protein [Phycisphaerae bacterium]HON65139.1 DUF4861 family protein [Phycisphaerae bacterium]HOQ86962.1 DUF4861 family protein [Phycisphaerae bacterium]